MWGKVVRPKMNSLESIIEVKYELVDWFVTMEPTK